jgi:lipopolysaccharide export system protein LptA
MDGHASITQPQTAETLTGIVTSADATTFVVLSGSTTLHAARAVSCLIEPKTNDRVMVARTVEGCFVLAVLTRSTEGATQISHTGDLEIKVSGGRLGLTATEGVSLVGADVSIAAGQVNIRAAAGQVIVQALDYIGSSVRAEIDSSSLVASTVDHVINRLKQRVQRSYRTIEEFDQVRAERIDYTARKTMTLHAANAIITSEGLVKVDGEQIHVG